MHLIASKLQFPAALPKSREMLNGYERPVGHPDELLKLISRTHTGREILEEFLPYLTKKKVSIEEYPSELCETVRKSIPEGHAIGACLVGARILIDFQAPRGVNVAYLVHEISIFLSRHRKSNKCQEATESEAFLKQVHFTCELRERDPEYEKFLKVNSSRAAALHDLLEFEIEDSSQGRAA